MSLQYRVRLLRHPIMLYNGRSFEQAALVMDATGEDRVLEQRTWDGWRSIISVENGTCAI